MVANSIPMVNIEMVFCFRFIVSFNWLLQNAARAIGTMRIDEVKYKNLKGTRT